MPVWDAGYATMGGSWPHNTFSVIIVEYDNAKCDIAERNHISIALLTLSNMDHICVIIRVGMLF